MEYLWICFAVIGMVVAAMLASSKGRNVVGWAVFGFLMPALAIILAVVLPAIPQPDSVGS